MFFKYFFYFIHVNQKRLTIYRLFTGMSEIYTTAKTLKPYMTTSYEQLPMWSWQCWGQVQMNSCLPASQNLQNVQPFQMILNLGCSMLSRTVRISRRKCRNVAVCSAVFYVTQSFVQFIAVIASIKWYSARFLLCKPIWNLVISTCWEDALSLG